jgi:hypothetical protein
MRSKVFSHRNCEAQWLRPSNETFGAARRGLRLGLPPYRLDNCHCAGRAKDSDEQQVALRRRKTTTKRSGW